MRTLSALHEAPPLLRVDEDVLRYVRAIPSWEILRLSTSGGASKPFYSGVHGFGLMLLPDTWTKIDIADFYSLRPQRQLVSVQLEDQDYAEIFSLVANRSFNRSSPVDQIN